MEASMDKKSGRPDCPEYIVAAIRALRTNVKNLRAGTAAGVALRRVFKTALKSCTEAGIYQALEILIHSETIRVVAPVYSVTRDASGNVRTVRLIGNAFKKFLRGSRKIFDGI